MIEAGLRSIRKDREAESVDCHCEIKWPELFPRSPLLAVESPAPSVHQLLLEMESQLLCSNPPEAPGVECLGEETAENGEELFFDHGASYFTVNDPLVLSLVHEWESRGVVAQWMENFGTYDRSSNKFLDHKTESRIKYVGVPGMNSICRSLCNEPGLESKFGIGVGKMNWSDTEHLWSLSGLDGKFLGSYNGVVASDKNIASPPHTEVTGRPPPLDLASRMQSIPARPCFALMLAFKEPLTSVPFKGFSFINSEVLSAAFCDSSKPRRSCTFECWVLHSTKEYAQRVIAEHGLTKPSNETLTKVAEDLLNEFQKTGLCTSEPYFKKAHRWGSAFPSISIATEEKCLFDRKQRAAICGDFCTSPSVEGAILSGISAASKFVDLLSSL
ncbi:hypothetical protein V2J09_015312 [Rumex salicifolius]